MHAHIVKKRTGVAKLLKKYPMEELHYGRLTATKKFNHLLID